MSRKSKERTIKVRKVIDQVVSVDEYKNLIMSKIPKLNPNLKLYDLVIHHKELFVIVGMEVNDKEYLYQCAYCVNSSLSFLETFLVRGSELRLYKKS